MTDWIPILLVIGALLLATWYLAEWASRRITRRYAGRKRLWGGPGPDDQPERDSVGL
jgi:hypothetical protein